MCGLRVVSQEGTLGFELVLRDVPNSLLTSSLMLGVLVAAGVPIISVRIFILKPPIAGLR